MSRMPTRIYPYLSHNWGRLPPLKRYSNYCLDFDAIGKSVSVAAVPNLHITGNLWVEAWIRPNSSGEGGFGRIMNKAPAISFYFNGAGVQDIRFEIRVAAAAQIAASVGGAVTYGRWHHIVGGYNGVNVLLFVDRVPFVGAATVGPIDGHLAANLTIGDRTVLGRVFDGPIDEFRFMPVAPTQALVDEAFKRGYAIREGDARCILRMEEGSGLLANDISGYGNNGVLLPAPTPPTWIEVMKHELLAEVA